MKKALAVMGYKGAEETIKRHSSNWLAANIGREYRDIVGLSGIDGTIWPWDFQFSIAVGIPGHDGPQSISRIVSFIEILAGLYDEFTIIEYDQLVFQPEVLDVPPHHIGCEMAPNHDPQFKFPFFALPPWTFGRSEAARFVSMARRLQAEGETEGDFFDRFIPLVAFRSGLEMHNMPRSITRMCDGIDDEFRKVKAMLLENKVSFFHGVKTQEQFDFLCP